ncbi:MAG: LuxR C-terminal-related transcriptional regulator [Acidimicrobiia bacterium]
MQVRPVDVARGYEALGAGDWHQARQAFEKALTDTETPEALEGLSQAWWWTGDEEQALNYRQRAHAAYRLRGDRARAVRCALWVSDEYHNVYGDLAAANGWLGRARRLLDDSSAAPAAGWMALAQARRTNDPATAEQLARQALAEAERWSDSELEAYGLAQLGLAHVTKGEVKEGLAELDEAMAIATSQDNLVVAGDTACSVMQAAELIGDLSPFMSWAQLIERYLFQHGHQTLIASCGTCCGEVFAATGDWARAESELLRTINILEQNGHRSRCSHPSAALASLRIRQGRLEEAEAILTEYSTLPEAVEPMGELLIAQGLHAPAIKLLERRLARIGYDNLRSVALLSLLAQALAVHGDRERVAKAALQLTVIADKSGLERVHGLAALARARSEPDQSAPSAYEKAIDLLEAARVPLEAATARLELVRLLSGSDRDLAVAEARVAHKAFDELGASRLADQAAALLRSLGARGQTGPKLKSRLTDREAEVLRLIAQGMTNAEIAERLFISQKTAANHVSNVLMKLGVRSRTEAAAVALTTASS